jgi:hypothetical protein
MRPVLLPLVLACLVPGVHGAPCPVEAALRYEPRTFLGYECPDDCERHKAGYAWAERIGLTDVSRCSALLGPGREGCMARIELASSSEAAGYRWALENEVVRPCECEGAGPGFRSGCLKQLPRR